MAFGTLKGTLVGGNNSIPNPLPATGSVVVAAGDLVVAVCTQQTALTVTACADNLGNTYNAQNAGTLSTISGRMYYARVTVPGTLTTINFTTTSSTNDGSCAAAVYSGPFIVSPLDANPANLSADLTTPYACPATGALAQALELCIGWFSAASTTTYTAGGGFTKDVQQSQSANAATCIASLAVNATTTQTPSWTGTAPSADVLGTASFKADLAVPALNKIFDDLPTRVVLPTDFPMSLRTWMQGPLPIPPVVITYIPSRVGQWGVPAELVPPARVRGYGRSPQAAASAIVDTTKMPGRVIDWGMWLDPRVAMTWVQSPMFAPPVLAHPVVVDWQLPIAPYRVPQTWTQAPFVGTPLPCNQYNWPLPVPPARQALTWLQDPPLPFPGKPVISNDWSLPIQPTRTALTWTQTPPLTLPVSAKPVNQSDWPLPIQSVRAALSWTQAPNFATPVAPIVFMPGRVIDWGVTDTPQRTALTWTQSPQLQPVSSAKPVNQADWPLPVRAIRSALTWVQTPMFATPVVVTPPTFMPGRVVDWGMAWETPRRALTYVRGVAGQDISTALPANQADWPLPVRTVERARTWTQSPMFAAPVAPIIFIPSRVTNWGVAELQSTIFVPAEIQNTVALHATPPPPKPINQYDWPVPIAAPRMAGGYSFAFARNTKDMSPVNMPPRIGVFSPPIGYYYPNSLRWFASFPFQGVGPSAASSGMVHNIPFIATMGGMTAR